jgi:hypothetical protein
VDPNLIVDQQPQVETFQMKFQEVLYYLGPIAQVLYWLGMLLFVGYAVWQFKRWVNFQMGVGKSGQLSSQNAAENSADKSVKVEEFVE